LSKALSIDEIPETTGTNYPAPFDAPVKARAYRRLGQAFGLTQFGVNIARLPPGVWSSQRHWHAKEDEFVYVLSGEVVMITNDGEQICGPGDCVGFRAGETDGHHFINRSDSDVQLLVVGARVDGDHGAYPDIDMLFTPRSYASTGAQGGTYTRKDGTPYD
jgi:uncharacterized cupin superfamily protein